MALALGLRGRAGWGLGVTSLLSCVCLCIPGTYETAIFFPYCTMFAAAVALYLAIERGWTAERLLGRYGHRVGVGMCVLALLGGAAGTAWGAWDAHENPVTHTALSLAFAVILWLVYPLDERLARYR